MSTKSIADAHASIGTVFISIIPYFFIVLTMYLCVKK